MAKTQFNITNGDSAANIIKASTVEGDVLPWRDPMHHGPFPAGPDLDAVSDIRSDYLAGDMLDSNEVRYDCRLRNEHMRTASRYDEVILWFEHDLLDQLQILQILDWFSNADIGSTQLSMICINAFPGFPNFRGIGELDGEQMASLLPERKPVTSKQLQIATAGWAAFRSPDPANLEVFVGTVTSAFPFLKAALQRHLEDYPWISDGLTRTERQILTLVSQGTTKPGRVFADNMDFEDALYIGDWSTWGHIADLCAAKEPLLACTSGEQFLYPPKNEISSEALNQQRLTVTDVGRDILSGKRHARDLIPRDHWLGGVHLQSDQPMWVWESTANRLILSEPS